MNWSASQPTRLVRRTLPPALSSQHLPQPLANKNQARTLPTGLVYLPSEAKALGCPIPGGEATWDITNHISNT